MQLKDVTHVFLQSQSEDFGAFEGEVDNEMNHAEFLEVSDLYGREDIGVVFCGAPMIAAQLKSSCERLSNVEKTVFRLHKENF